MSEVRTRDYARVPTTTISVVGPTTLVTGVPGLKIVLIEAVVSNPSAVDNEVTFYNGATAEDAFQAPKRGTFSYTPEGGLRTSAGNALRVVLASANAIKMSIKYTLEQ